MPISTGRVTSMVFLCGVGNVIVYITKYTHTLVDETKRCSPPFNISKLSETHFFQDG